MSTQELVYKFQLEVDKIDSQDFPDLPLPAKITLLNKGILMYVEACYGVNNIFRQGLESTQLRIDQLQTIIEKDEPDLDYVVNTHEPNTFTADFSHLVPNTYLHLARSFSYADKGICKDRVIYNQQVTHDELNVVLSDPNRSPSFEWQELPIVQAANKIYAYTDSTFTPTKVHIDYLKYPVKIDLVGYQKIDGTPSTTVDSDLPDFLLERIITATARFTKAILGDEQGEVALEKESIIQN